MKTPVLDLKDYIKFLNKNKEEIGLHLQKILSPEEIKRKTAEALVSSRGQGAVAMKEVLDSIKDEAYYRGQLSVIDHLIMMAEQHLKNYEEAVKNGTV